ncbi:MAG: hypothetical protein ACE15C_14665 [Phycisphaerae bacterium]
MKPMSESLLSVREVQPQHGAIILFRGTGSLARAIMDATGQGYSHVAQLLQDSDSSWHIAESSTPEGPDVTDGKPRFGVQITAMGDRLAMECSAARPPRIDYLGLRKDLTEWQRWLLGEWWRVQDMRHAPYNAGALFQFLGYLAVRRVCPSLAIPPWQNSTLGYVCSGAVAHALAAAGIGGDIQPADSVTPGDFCSPAWAGVFKPPVNLWPGVAG